MKINLVRGTLVLIDEEYLHWPTVERLPQAVAALQDAIGDALADNTTGRCVYLAFLGLVHGDVLNQHGTARVGASTNPDDLYKVDRGEVRASILPYWDAVQAAGFCPAISYGCVARHGQAGVSGFHLVALPAE